MISTGLRSIFSSTGFLLLATFLLSFAATDVVSAPAQNSSSSATDKPGEELKKEWSEAIEALKQYSVEQRDQAMKQAEQTLNAMDRRIEQLESRSESNWEQLNKQMRQQRESTLRTLRQQRNELAEWYGGMQHSSDDAWEEVKQGFIKSYGILGDSFADAWSELTKNDRKDADKEKY